MTRIAHDRTASFVGMESIPGLWDKQVAENKQLGRGDIVREVFLRTDEKGEPTGNRQAKRMARAILRKGRS